MTKKKKRTYTRWFFIIPIVIIVVIVILELTNTTHIFHKQPTNISIVPSSTTTPNTTTPSSVANNVNKTPSAVSSTEEPTTNNSGSQKQSSSSSTQVALVAPTGTFVSNHNPGVGSPTQEESICNTTPGATCTIQFTMGSTVKALTAQIVGSTGAVYWSWDATTSSSGLTPGSWAVSAVATLNGQTMTSNDVTPLVIQQ